MCRSGSVESLTASSRILFQPRECWSTNRLPQGAEKAAGGKAAPSKRAPDGAAVVAEKAGAGDCAVVSDDDDDDDDGEGRFNRNDTYTKSDRKRVTEKLAAKAEAAAVQGMRRRTSSTPTAAKTNFKEMADRRRSKEGGGSILRQTPPTSSALSWYIPSDPPSRLGQLNVKLDG